MLQPFFGTTTISYNNKKNVRSDKSTLAFDQLLDSGDSRGYFTVASGNTV